MIEPTIAVIGCKTTLPIEFPIEFSENSGNMIHGRAPLELFPKAFHSEDTNRPWGNTSSFRTWANAEASHVIITLANTIRMDRSEGASYLKLINNLETYSGELVVFGLGIQSTSMDLESATLPPEAIELMKYLGERCKAVGVRGEFTAKAFSHFAGVENTVVTGCPSLFSQPSAIKELYENWKTPKPGIRAYSGTNYNRPEERLMLRDSIKANQFLIEPVNSRNHAFYLESTTPSPDSKLTPPFYLNRYLNDKSLTISEIRNYYAKYYRLFRNVNTWYDFNRESVSLTYGTRFHVNMASLLSGTPALWITHDARTEELTDFCHLPRISLTKAIEMSPEEIEQAYDPSDFFDNIRDKFNNFNNYLDIFGLPAVKLKF